MELLPLFTYKPPALLLYQKNLVCFFFLKPRFTFEAKFYFPGSLSFCTEELYLGLGNSCWKARGCLFAQVVSFLLSVALFPDIWTIKGLPTSLALDLRLKAGSLVLWVGEDEGGAGGQLLGLRKTCVPRAWPSDWKEQSRWSPSPGILLASHWLTVVKNAKIPGPSGLIFHFLDHLGLCFFLFYISILELLNYVSHPTPPTKLSETLWKLFHGPAFSNPSGLPSDKNDWYPHRDLHSFSHTETHSYPVTLTA